MFLRNITLALALASVTAISGFSQGTGTTTTTTTTHDFSIGPVGLASTETIQINVANLAENESNGTAASCAGSVSFNNSSGTAIGSSTPFTLTAGQIASVSLPYAKASSSTGRIELIGVIAMTTTSGTSTSQAPCRLVYSVETFDTTSGVTHLFLSGGDGTGAASVLPGGFGGQGGQGGQGGPGGGR